MNMGEMLLAILFSYVACLAFTLIYNMRGRFIWLAPLGGAISWCVYNLFAFIGSDIVQNFIAAMAATVYSETLARLNKAPATMFLIVGLLPLVPGAGIYYTMDYCISGNQIAFQHSLVHTLAVAGALTLGIVLVSSLYRLWFQLRFHHRKKRQAKGG